MFMFMCVSVYIYVCVSICICPCVCQYMYMSMCVSVYVYVHVCVSICICVCVHRYMYGNASISVPNMHKVGWHAQYCTVAYVHVQIHGFLHTWIWVQELWNINWYVRIHFAGCAASSSSRLHVHERASFAFIHTFQAQVWTFYTAKWRSAHVMRYSLCVHASMSDGYANAQGCGTKIVFVCVS
jgi:hypothetical protein